MSAEPTPNPPPADLPPGLTHDTPSLPTSPLPERKRQRTDTHPPADQTAHLSPNGHDAGTPASAGSTPAPPSANTLAPISSSTAPDTHTLPSLSAHLPPPAPEPANAALPGLMGFAGGMPTFDPGMPGMPPGPGFAQAGVGGFAGAPGIAGMGAGFPMDAGMGVLGAGAGAPPLQISLVSEHARPPVRGSAMAAGYDICAAEAVVVPAYGRVVVGTGVKMAVPPGTYGRIAPRSGLAVKHGISTGAGVIDADYRGEVRVLLFNHSDVEYQINIGDRIAQLVLEVIVTPEVSVVGEVELGTTVRGAGGFGSTGRA